MTVEFSKTELGRQRADWALADGQISVLGFVDNDGGAFETARFDRVNALWSEPDGVVFPDGVALARIRAILPEYHGLWCAVSEQARVLGLDRLSSYSIRVIRAMSDNGEWWSERLCREHELSRTGATRSLNWLCRHGYVVGTGQTVDTGRHEHEAVYRLTETGRCTFKMLSELPR